MSKLLLVRLNVSYCNYLRKYDNKIPYTFKDKKLRPFVGVLFVVNKLMYFAPLSSPKPKHIKLKSKLDFLKIKNGELGAINFNNMIPVKENNIVEIDLNKKYMNQDKEKYNKLLKEQLNWLNHNKNKVIGRAEKLCSKYNNGTLNKAIFNRCCNFKLLEQKCEEYSK